jgi:hypothetical protein
VIFGWTLATVVVVLAVTFVVARSLGRHNVMDVGTGNETSHRIGPCVK